MTINMSNNRIEFLYETHALFEADLTGLMLADGDFLIFDRFGMQIVSLKREDNQRKLRSSNGSK